MLSFVRAPLRLAIGALALLLAMDGCVQGGPTSSKSPAASTPPPVLSAPVVYFERPPSDTWQAVDWNGTLHEPLTSNLVGMPYQSPDGSRVLWSPQGVWQIVDRLGQVLSRPDFPGNREVTWADDSSGICLLNGTDSNGGSYALEFKSALGGSRNIAMFTTKVGPNLAVCSPSASRIVITTATGYKDPSTELRRITFYDLRVIDFTSGKLVLRRTFPVGKLSTEVNSVIVSHDGSVAALSTRAGTEVIDLTNGQTVSRALGVTPDAFSWNGTLLAVTAARNRGELLSVETGQVVWSDPQPGRVTQGAASKPGGPDVMFLATTGDYNDLLVVSPSGAQRVLASDVFVDQITPCFNCSAY